MRVNIQPYWRKIADWYWEDFFQPNDGFHMSIWDVLARDYGAKKAFNITSIRKDRQMWVVFPNEQSYTMFLLRWS